MNQLETWIPSDLLKRYDFYNYNHAAEILSQSFPNEFRELFDALRAFNISVADITALGGNESPIPPKLASILEPQDWKEIKISGDLLIRIYPRAGKKKSIFSETPIEERTLANYIDGHNIDFVKNRVAIDVEWNSKDQTFDRDLFAMRTYYECGIISVGIIITRSEKLNPLFNKLGKEIKDKYGSSTTWMGKLIPRLDSRRHGGCPILAVGITPDSVMDKVII